MTVLIVACYLVVVLLIGGFSHRLFRGTGEDYFLASRSIGPFVLLMSLFGTHMTAFSLLGASGESYRAGIGVFALMASSSALVVPVVFYFLGVRLWAIGKRHGFITQVQFFRERFESTGLGLLLFAFLTLLLVPYLLISVLGSGLTLAQITGGQVPVWVGSLTVCLVVMTYVTYGGMRGTAWVNTFQTSVFMVLGLVTYLWILREIGGLEQALEAIGRERPELLVRGEAIAPLKMLSYLLIPLSVGMFPHIFMHWLTARDARAFRLPIIAYPICIAIVWVPSVLLGMVGVLDFPDLVGPASNSILVRLIDLHAPAVLAGLLAAGVFAAIMSSLDSQVLSLGTLFTQDIVRHFRSGGAMSERAQVLAGRVFVALILLATFAISLVAKPSLFRLGIWSFTGFSSLVPLAVAAVYWRRTTKQGAYASVLTAFALWVYFFARSWNVPGYSVGGTGMLPVAVIVAASALSLIVVSLISPRPSVALVERFFPE